MTSRCPMCQGEMTLAPLPDLIIDCQISEEGEDVLNALARARGSWLTTPQLLDAIATGWADVDQPDYNRGLRIVRKAVDEITWKLPGVQVVRYGIGWRLKLADAVQPTGSAKGMSCPCCGRWLTPSDITREALVVGCSIPEQQARVIAALWGRKQPVRNRQILASMFGDVETYPTDPAAAYLALKVAMSRLRGALNGTGFGIINAGYAGGYLLQVREGENHASRSHDIRGQVPSGDVHHGASSLQHRRT